MESRAQATQHAGMTWEVFLVSLRLGLTSFGGPAAHVGYFRREYVEQRRWVTADDFGELTAITHALPGPASSQLGIAIGTQRAGVTGGIAAWVGFTLPSAAILTMLALVTVDADLAGSGWVRGLVIAAIAVVAQAVIAMARTLTPDLPRGLLAIAALVLVLAWPGTLTPLVVIGGGALLGAWVVPVMPASPAGRLRSPVSRRFAMGCLVLFAALLVGLPLSVDIVDGGSLDLFDRMFRTGALVFGGGHVVLPLLDTAVVEPGWVSETSFMAGYGAAQAMPGPLFGIAAYLGAVASVGPGGAAGALIALVGIFLPSFLLVWGVLPFWDTVRRSVLARRVAAGISAAVVGLLAAALVDLVRGDAITGPADAILAVVATGLVVSGRVPPIGVVALCAFGAELISRV
ncbi:MAG: chromate efflux transporter [Chloroflexi bacterium]|nr:chromate efflux transporter [Chloroflexota bacterium]